MVELIIWFVLPFASIAIFLMGLIWQYDHKDDYKKGFKNTLCISLGLFILVTGIFSLKSELTIFHWVINVFSFNLSDTIMANAPLLVKVNVLSLCSLLIILPFTHYIKLFNFFSLKGYIVVGLVFYQLTSIGIRLEGLFRNVHKTKTKAVKEF
ncbi:respiratory nitrate reductase subunit gamma [Aquibacillus saliphilus]|uniref:respiratory nitrate reductase subunit gamma n=1 Tax=Aquibacillus saliphilus TaxID=1909422 RepID=UPI001CF0398D|nr:respiratory nitrate reductase subunit gamma [Aquibacillus saliphilus]